MDNLTIYNNNDEARAALFAGFGKFQAAFSALLASYAKSTDKVERAALATAFVKDIAIPTNPFLASHCQRCVTMLEAARPLVITVRNNITAIGGWCTRPSQRPSGSCVYKQYTCITPNKF